MNADLTELCEYLVSTTPEKMVANAVKSPAVEKEIVKLNTKDQLGKFIDSDGNKLADNDPLGGYSELTQQIKGLGREQVNLKDTGDYWNSFEVSPIKGGYEIDSDTIKEGVDLRVRWGDIEGLTKKHEKIAEREIEKEVWNQAQAAL